MLLYIIYDFIGKIKPGIKAKLLKIVARIRKRIEEEESKAEAKFHRRMSIRGQLRRDIFDHDSDSSNSQTDNNMEFKTPKRLKSNADLLADEILQKTGSQAHMNINENSEGDIEKSKMNEEESYEPSGDNDSSKENSSEESKNNSNDSSSSSDSSNSSSGNDSPNIPYSEFKHGDGVKPKKKSSSKKNKYKSKKKWKKHLNISRNTIVEVDEEQRSDTSNKKSSCISLVFGNLIASSDHKSTRRFHKASGTLKGNSPDTSMNAQNKDLSEYSNPYYEQANSSSGRPSGKVGKKLNLEKVAKLNQNIEILSPNEIDHLTLGKKNSSKDLRTKLAADYDAIVKPSKSARSKSKGDKITLSVGRLRRDDDDEDYIKHARSNDIKKNQKVDYFLAEEEVKFTTNSPSQAKSGSDSKKNKHPKKERLTDSSKYIQRVDSPISSTKEGFDFKNVTNTSNESSLEDIDDDLNITNPSGLEEERKLSLNESSVSNDSASYQDFSKENTKDLNSVEDSAQKMKASKGPKTYKMKDDSTTLYGTGIQSQTKFGLSSGRIKRSDNKMIDTKNMHAINSDMLYYGDNVEVVQSNPIENDKPQYNEVVIE